MKRLLYIKASPRGQRSHSLAVADVFVETYRKRHPEAVVEVRDLFAMDLPKLDGAMLEAKYNIMHGLEHSAEQKARWRAVEAVIEDFTSFDRYVFAVPMWNFNFPYVLKHYMDVIIQPSYTFTTTAEGYHGLTEGKAFVAYARGGEYPPDSGADAINFQARHFEWLLRFIGLEQIFTVVVQPTLQGPEKAKESRLAAMDEARSLVVRF
ncbi:MAG: FMN-dependent NADH-azoreductase [Deltaproteobacteria bacterium]|nr:FMN-dependent NADH-azoreductase [Deltaproteobacteria bacterium]